MSDDQQFEAGDAGSADTTPSTAGDIKKGGYCMLKSFPCKVSEYSTAKPGKHGSAKATIVGNDIFTNKRYEEICPTSGTMRVPNVTKVELEVADVDDDDFVTLIKLNGQLKQDLKLPVDDEKIYPELKKIWDQREDKTVLFSIIAACGHQKIVSGRTKD